MMLKKNRFGKLALAIVLLSALWGLLFLARFILTTPVSDNRNFVPSDAEMVVVLDGNELLKHSFEDIVLKTQDNRILKLIKNRFESNREGVDENWGLNLNSDIIQFSIWKNGQPLTGILFNLSDPEAFERISPKMIVPKREAFAVAGNVGLILSQTDDSITPTELKRIAKSIIHQNEKFKLKESRIANTIAVITLTEKADIAPFDMNLQLNVAMHDQMIELFGTMQWKKDDFLNIGPYMTMDPKGFHFSSCIVPSDLNDSLQHFIGMDLPDIRSISLNLSGTDLVNEAGVFVVPDFDLLVEFSDSLELSKTLNNLQLEEEISNLTDKSFTFGTKFFHYHQLTPTTVFIGRRQIGTIRKTSNDLLLVAKGDLKAFTQVNGKGIMRRLLELVSMYSAGKQFAEHTDHFELSLKKTGEAAGVVKGTIEFKDGHYPTNEVVRLLINGQLLQ